MKKKLLVTASTFPRGAGDTEPRFILDLCREYAKYYDVTALVPGAPGALNREDMEGVHVIRYRYFPIKALETLCYPGAIVPRIRENKLRILLVPFLLGALWLNLKKYAKGADIIHVHWLIPQGIVMPFINNTPYIITGHGGDVTSLNFWPVKALKAKALKGAKHITVVSKALKEYTDRLYPNNKTSVISMGCDTTSFSPDKRVEGYFGSKDKGSILFVGRLAEKKGVSYLIEVMAHIDDAILYIAGKGDLEDKLKEQAAPYGDKIVFLGPKTHEELPALYASADVFVAPSVTARDGDKEGFGLVIIEAMASGTPVVATNSGGIPDIITHGKNGLLCEERDVKALAGAIKRLMEDKGLRASITQRGLETANTFSYENIGLRYREIIEKV